MNNMRNFFNKIFLDKNTNIFSFDRKLNLIATFSDSSFEKKLKNLSKIEYFNYPYEAMVAIKDKKIVDSWKIHPNTFYPQTPLDYETPINQYIAEDIAYPIKFLTNLTDRCDSACTVCSFNTKREKYIPTDIDGKKYCELIGYMKKLNPDFSQNISGGGEPSIHPDFTTILNFAGNEGIETFLTTNGRINSRIDKEKLDAIASNVSILTFSIMGVSSDIYSQLHQPRDPEINFDHVLRNIEYIINKRSVFGREKKMIIGVATLIHPANTSHYTNFIHQLISLGVDYVYVNPIQPNLMKFGLSYTKELAEATKAELSSLQKKFSSSKTFIRIPEVLYKTTDTVYIDAKKRKNLGTCLVSILQPSIIPVPNENNEMQLVSCRYSKLHFDPQYCFSKNLSRGLFDKIWNKDNVSRISYSAQNCEDCCCERQLMALDWMLYCKKTYPGCYFMLQFDKTISKGGVEKFENTISTSYDRSNIIKGDEC